MTKVSNAHWELCNAARHIARNLVNGHEDDVDVEGGVQRYHRTDGYRNLTVRAGSREQAVEIDTRLKAYATKFTNVRIYFDEVGKDMLGRDVVGLSVWPA